MPNITPPSEQPFNPIVANVGGTPMANSRDVARFYGKRHDNVLQSIDKLGVPKEWGLLNFQETTYTDPQNGQEYRSVNMLWQGNAVEVSR